MKKALTVSFAAALLGLQATVASAGDMERAMELYERQHYAMARDFFHAAARAGNAQAQEILGFMYAFGPEVYPGVARDLQAAASWFDRAARGGRPVGRYMACAVARHTQDTPTARHYCFDWIADTGQPGPR